MSQTDSGSYKVVPQVASLSHDLRNQLGVIVNCVELIRQQGAGDHDDHLNVILRAAESCLRLCRDSLERSIPKSVNLAAELDQIVSDLRSGLEAPGIRITFESCVTAVKVRLVPAELRQILYNLLINAVDAMPQGGRINVRLDCVYEPEPNQSVSAWARITVDDTGQGISSDKIHCIFQTHYTTKPDGHGVGLSIIQQLVTSNGGKLNVMSVQGAGTQFQILFRSSHVAS